MRHSISMSMFDLAPEQGPKGLWSKVILRAVWDLLFSEDRHLRVDAERFLSGSTGALDHICDMCGFEHMRGAIARWFSEYKTKGLNMQRYRDLLEKGLV